MSVAESQGHDAADRLDVLYREHASDVYRYAYAVLGNRADAEDVTQTTFVNALRALERGDRPHTPDHWLIVITHNLCRQRWRQAASRPAEVELVSEVPALERDDDQPRLDDLVHALQRIPPSQREALVMRELEGRSYAEIAEILGLTTGALETLLFRARRSLADELENLVTCERAELDLTRRLDGRLSRKERRRLEEHLAVCSACARRADTYSRQRRAFTGLAVLPLPLGLSVPHLASAPAAAGLTVVAGGASGGAAAGASATAGPALVAASGGVSAAGTGASGILGGSLAKIAAVVIAGTVATGAGVKGVDVARTHLGSPERAAPAAASSPSEGAAAAAAATRIASGGSLGPAAIHPTPGKALGRTGRIPPGRRLGTAKQSLAQSPGGATSRGQSASARGQTKTGGQHAAVKRHSVTKPKAKPVPTRTRTRTRPTTSAPTSTSGDATQKTGGTKAQGSGKATDPAPAPAKGSSGETSGAAKTGGAEAPGQTPAPAPSAATQPGDPAQGDGGDGSSNGKSSGKS